MLHRVHLCQCALWSTLLTTALLLMSLTYSTHTCLHGSHKMVFGVLATPASHNIKLFSCSHPFMTVFSLRAILQSITHTNWVALCWIEVIDTNSKVFTTVASEFLLKKLESVQPQGFKSWNKESSKNESCCVNPFFWELHLCYIVGDCFIWPTFESIHFCRL